MDNSKKKKKTHDSYVANLPIYIPVLKSNVI